MGNAPKLVLVVEDDPSAAAMMSAALNAAGIMTRDARSVGEAWREVTEKQPDLCIVDINLPTILGWELIDRIRKHARAAQTPVIVISGDLDDAAIERAKRYGCDWIAKPFDPELLVEKVREHLSSVTKISVVLQRAMILTDVFTIEGNLHIPAGEDRFSDAIEGIMNDSRNFVPVTDAKVVSNEGGNVIAQTGFMQVNKGHIRGVLPLEEPPVELGFPGEAAASDETDLPF